MVLVLLLLIFSDPYLVVIILARLSVTKESVYLVHYNLKPFLIVPVEPHPFQDYFLWV